VFNSGLLARPRPSRGARYDYGVAAPELVARAGTIADVCERRGVMLPQAALAFPLAHPAVVSVCFGARSPQQIGRNAELFRAPLPATLWAELKTAGLMREDDAPCRGVLGPNLGCPETGDIG
jgi:D-threo-aldose 1-dehydrogenase